MRLRKRWTVATVILAFLVVVIAFHPLYLRALGNYLVVSDPLVKSDALVVLDGDYPRDERLLYAIRLWQEGYAPKIVLSARLGDWMTYADYPSWRHAMKLNVVPRKSLLVVGHDADSTIEEAHRVLPCIHDHGFKKVIIVTSSYHTRRARVVFTRAWAGSGIDFIVSAAASSEYHPDEWWQHRTDSKTFFYEFSKTIWYRFME